MDALSWNSSETKTGDMLIVMKTAIMSTSLCLVIIASIIGNGLVFLVFYKRPSLVTISNRFIINLTVCNSLNTLLVMPFMLSSLIAKYWMFGEFWCKGTGFLMNTIFAASTLTLVAISLDRYCAVATPLHYSMRITSKRSIIAILSVWTLAVLTSLPPLLGWNHYEYQEDKASCTVYWGTQNIKDRYYTIFLVSVTFIFPLGAIVSSYIAIFKTAKNNFERTRKNSSIHSNVIEEGIQTPLRDGRRHSSTATILVRRLSASSRTGSLLWHKDEWKTALTSLLVVSTFVVCWLPYFIIIGLESLLIDPTSIYPIIESVSILLAMSSCACNPLVYVFRSKLARQELRTIFWRRPREKEIMSESRRGSTSVAVRDGIIRQGSTESDVIIEKPLHTSSTTTTLTSLVPGKVEVFMRS